MDKYNGAPFVERLHDHDISLQSEDTRKLVFIEPFAAEKAGCKDFIDRLPDGFRTYIGDDGVLLSGGQRQRLAIARAFYKNSPIVILDEATSALDTESESFIQESIDELTHGKTTIIIAHRLSTIEKANRILVIDEGIIAEQGSHKELLESEGLYKQLYKNHDTDGATRKVIQTSAPKYLSLIHI